MFSRRLLFIPLVLLLNSSCATIQYYGQSTKGHLQVWWPQQPIDTLLASEDTDPQLKEKLRNVQQARRFASTHLHLPDNDSYTGYTDLGRPFVVWNVVAAPEFSLQAHHWCYLIVGCVSYRGYFQQQNAEQFAKELQQQGYDVNVGGVAAYSTLGWFDDPVLNSILQWQDRRVAELIFHELSHQVIYLSGQTAFNEAFATATARLGMAYWLQHTHGDLQDYLAFLAQHHEFRTLLLDTRQQLETLYASDLSEADKRHQKAQIFSELKQQHRLRKPHWHTPDAFDRWFDRDLNNAHLVSSMTYLEHVPAFYSLFLQSNRDWDAYFAAVRALGKLDETSRKEKVQQLLEQAITLPRAIGPEKTI